MPPKPITERSDASQQTFYGDNLPILREYVPTESVDLVYLDPPFNSNRSYNVLFRDESGHDSESQLVAFDDTWHWGDAAEQTYHDLVNDAPAHVGGMIGALRQFIGANQMMAYLVMMAARLVELHRVLKPTGSLYLHCDPTASHYLKVVLDTIFGPEAFRNEIVWKRTTAHSDTKTRTKTARQTFMTFSIHTRGSDWTWNPHLPALRRRVHQWSNIPTWTVTADATDYGDMTGPGGAAKGNPLYEVYGRHELLALFQERRWTR